MTPGHAKLTFPKRAVKSSFDLAVNRLAYQFDGRQHDECHEIDHESQPTGLDPSVELHFAEIIELCKVRCCQRLMLSVIISQVVGFQGYQRTACSRDFGSFCAN